MCVNKKKLPIGIENFEEIRTGGFYYVDKTELIKELLDNWGKVNLFTRPRRFGKTLNMSMLRYFFEYGTNPVLFEGLKIAEETALCEQYMGNFPVISISLKGVDGKNFESASIQMGKIIQAEARRFQFLLQSDMLTEIDKTPLRPLFENKISFDDQIGSLLLLSEMLYKHYGRKAIILIDEYDVPLDKAYEKGYYDDMLSYIRSIFEKALKTNEYLYFAVVTGCLRISKESIFTGLNNFKIRTISDVAFAEYFGFMDKEVKEMLAYYGLSHYFDAVKDWYDGYHFGNVDVYCPWDVINYCDALCENADSQPTAFWANTSSNSIVRRIIDKSTATTKRELEQLIAGEALHKEIIQELTYQNLQESENEDTEELMDYLWSVLYTTGYLTQKGTDESGKNILVIPNLEVQQIFEKQILAWFRRDIKSDSL